MFKEISYFYSIKVLLKVKVMSIRRKKGKWGYHQSKEKVGISFL